ncbi:MAG: hypothetical protein MSG64_06320 [Pyrinomonadaceae bacterium MAG19_C2-C3]|nr:hypothetical protein [Pyrinomonadaceae bacterium MAG19_C2-C3]
MNTQSNTPNPITFLGIEEVPPAKKFVVYATTEAVDIDGVPLKKIPLCLVEDVDTNLTDALIAGGNIYHADDWFIEYEDARGVSERDLAILKIGMPEGSAWNIFMPTPPPATEWAEFICLPEGVCTACGGLGYLTMDCCAGGEKYELHGDCDACEGDGTI